MRFVFFLILGGDTLLLDDDEEERQTREDGLRLRRIGLSQLLDAIKSKRTLFGKRLKGARQAFQAMDRDGDGIVTYVQNSKN